MDGLSAGASVFAVISLAFQLTGCLKELYKFWSSISEAPEPLQSIIDDLRLLSTIVSEVESQSSHCHSSPTMEKVLQKCLRKIEVLQAITNEFEKGFTSANRRMRVWSAIKLKSKKEKIDGFKFALMDFKSTLLVAQNMAFYQSINERFDKQQQQVILSMSQIMEKMELERSSQTVTVPIDSGAVGLAAALEREVNRMASKEGNPTIRSGFKLAMNEAIQQLLSQSPGGKVQNTTPTRIGVPSGHLLSHIPRFGVSTRKRRRDRTLLYQSKTEINIFFGKIHFSSQTFRVFSDEGDFIPDRDFQDETEIAFIFHPASWIVNLGFLYGLKAFANQSGQAWKHVMETFRPVPDDSEIFKLCKEGNNDAVKVLLSPEGGASPWDTNSTGWTPLHFAAQSVNPELCKLLLKAGADRSARPYKYSYSCLSLATERNSDYSILKMIETLNIFLDEAEDFDDSCGDGWTTLYSLEELELEGTHIFDADQSAFAWFVKLLHPDIRMGIDLSNDKTSIYSLLGSAIASSSLEVFEFILDTFNDAVDIRSGDGEVTLLVTCLQYREYAIASSLIQRGANLHVEGYDLEIGNMLLCPTTYALFSSASFFEWRKLLKTQSVDMEAFIALAVKQTSIIRDGWRTDALQKLFDLDFEPTPQPILHRCVNFDSSEECVGEFVELSWQRLLERIILGEDLMGIFEGYPTSKDSERAISQSDTKKYFNSNYKESGSLSKSQVDIPILETDLMLNYTKLEDTVDDGAAGWLCVTCWESMFTYEDGSESDKSSDYECVTDGEESNEESDQESNEVFRLHVSALY